MPGSQFRIYSIVFLALLSGCTNGLQQFEIALSTPAETSNYTEASCLFKFNEGNAAEAITGSQILEVQFGKKFDFNLLSPVLGASASELVRFAEPLGLRFYKTAPWQPQSCAFGESLPPAPQDLETMMEPQRKITFGKYLPKGTPNLPSTTETAAIIVAADTNKWVLTHEYMHHVFRLAEEGEQNAVEIESAARQSIRQLFSEDDALENETGVYRRKHMQEALRWLRIHNRNSIALVRTFHLEEIVIETLLTDLHDKGVFTFVPSSQKINAAFYIVRSAKMNESYIRQMLSLNSNKLIEYDEVVSPADRESLEEYNRQLSSLLETANSLSAKAQELLQKESVLPVTMTGVRSAAPNKAELHCAHELDITEFIDTFIALEKRSHARAQKR